MLVEAVLTDLNELLCQFEFTISLFWLKLSVLHYLDRTYLPFADMHSNLWVVDSGASSHFSVVREDFIALSLSDSWTVSGIFVRERGHGSCKLTLVDSA